MIIGGYSIFPVIFRKIIMVENAPYLERVVIETKFNLLTRFAFTCGLYPITCLAAWRLARIKQGIRKLLCCLLILGSMAAAFAMRYSYLKKRFRELGPAEYLRDDFGMLSRTGFPVRSLHFEYSMLAGLLAGLLVSVIIFRILPPKKVTID